MLNRLRTGIPVVLSTALVVAVYVAGCGDLPLGSNELDLDKVATGEHCHNQVMFKQLLQAEAIDVLQLDATRVAGVNENIAILLLAAKFGVPVCPHAGGVGLCEMVQHLAMFDFVAVGKYEKLLRRTDLLGRNSRFSYPAIGDLGAQIACARTGQDRLSAIVNRYGPETIAAATLAGGAPRFAKVSATLSRRPDRVGFRREPWMMLVAAPVLLASAMRRTGFAAV